MTDNEKKLVKAIETLMEQVCDETCYAQKCWWNRENQCEDMKKHTKLIDEIQNEEEEEDKNQPKGNNK